MIHEETVEKLIEETSAMTAYTKSQPGMDQPDDLANRLTSMNAYLARSGEINATAKLLLKQQVAQIYDVIGPELSKMKATDAKRVVTTKTMRTEFLIDLSERLNSNLVHEGNNIRRQLQYISDQMNII